ncbi:MAG: hypothetical protein H7841_13335 [Magnetospirillum sp. WYHS-4]
MASKGNTCPGLPQSGSRRGGHRQLVVAWTLAVALIAQVLGATAFPGNSLAHFPPADVLGEGMEVCTPQGIVIVGRDGPLTPSHAKHKETCVFCLPLMQAAKMPAAPLDLADVAMSGPIAIPPRRVASGVGSPRVWGASFPQAPPSS